MPDNLKHRYLNRALRNWRMNIIAQYGLALYGPRWRAAMADDLGVNERTVRRWAAGEFEPPQGAIDDLRRIAKTRIKELTALC